MGEFKSRNLLTSLAVFAAVFFCSAAVSAETFEADGIFYKTTSENEVEVTQNADKVWGYTGSVTIPETVIHEGKTYSVTAIGERAFKENNYLKQIILPSITEIKESAFEGCEILTDISSTNNLKVIGNRAFYECESLQSIHFDAPLSRIDDEAFFSCDGLSDIVLPESVEFFGSNVFYGTWWDNKLPDGEAYLGSVLYKYKGTVPESYTIKEGTKAIVADAFANKAELKTVNIPASVKSIGVRAFSGCTNLANVNFANESGIESLGMNAFNNTAWLNAKPDGEVYIADILYSYKGTVPESYTVKDGTKKISVNAFMFQNFKSLTIPASVTEIGNNAFCWNYSLETVNFSEGLKHLGFGVFNSCENLSSVTLPKSLESIGNDAFSECGGLQNINVAEGNKNFCSVDGVMFSKDMKTLMAFPEGRTGDYVIPETVEHIGDNAFYKAKVKSVTVPANVVDMGINNFYECKSLETLTFKNPSRLKKLEMYTVGSNPVLTTLVLPDSLEFIGKYSINYCNSLADIKFPKSLKLTETVYGSALMRTKWFDDQPDGVVYAGNLAVCIKENVPENLVFKDSTEYINECFLNGNRTVKSVTFPENLRYINKEAFAGGDSIVEISGGLNSGFGMEVFKGTPWFNNQITDDNSVAYHGGKAIGIIYNTNSIVDIKEGTEYLNLGKCKLPSISSIWNLVLPRSLKTIAKDGFKNIEIANTIKVKSPVPPVFEGDPSLWKSLGVMLIVPESCLEAYRNAPGWRLFRNIVGDPNLSGVEAIETADNVRVFADGENIVIEGVEEGSPVEVFNLNGQRIYSGVESLINVADKGIYIVRVDGKAYKVAM